MGPKPRITLDRYRCPSSRLCVIQDYTGYPDDLSDVANLAFGHSIEEMRIWESVFRDDLIIISYFDQHIRTYAGVVVGKSIDGRHSDPTGDPLVLHLDVVGCNDERQPSGGMSFRRDFIINAPEGVFRREWEKCRRLRPDESGRRADEIDRDFDGISVGVASSNEDIQYMCDASEDHVFGFANAPFKIVAKEDGRHVGAMLVEQSGRSQRTHNLALRVFGSELPSVRKSAVFIKRIFIPRGGKSIHRVQQAMFDYLMEIAPGLLDEPISIIEGASYDYLPVAERNGFNIETNEDDPYCSFYYWKPLNIDPKFAQRAIQRLENRDIARSLIRERRSMRYWMVTGSPGNIEKGVRNFAWAIRRSATNIGRWRSVAVGDVVFLSANKERISAAGVVRETTMDVVPGFEEYPLWIYFDRNLVSGLDIDLNDRVDKDWLRDSRGGVLSIDKSCGEDLRNLAWKQGAGRKMWIEPNPYLLRDVDFEEKKGQVFIVQAWSLMESVLPSIKKILEKNDFRVVFAGDRDGQVVFSDIWMLMNESEAVIVDFTLQRPNVYLEYGMALVLGKPIIAITQSKKDIPSDTPQLKYTMYEDTLKGLDRLEEKLPRAVADVMADIRRHKTSP